MLFLLVTLEDNHCGENFACRDGRVCVHGSALCDGTENCPEGDDEGDICRSCPHNCTCSGDIYECIVAGSLPMLPSGVRSLYLTGSHTSIKATCLWINHLATVVFLVVDTIQIEPEVYCFLDLIDIEILQLTGSNFHILGQHVFSPLIKLTKLSLVGNAITVIPENILYNNTRLKDMDFSRNKIHEINRYVLSCLQALVTLNLSFNQIHYVHTSAFECLVSLIMLDLQHNRLVSLHADTFGNTKSLQHLDIQVNYIQWDHAESLRALNITRLFINNMCCGADAADCNIIQHVTCFTILPSIAWLGCILSLGIVICFGNIYLIFRRISIWISFQLDVKSQTPLLLITSSNLFVGVFLVLISASDLFYRQLNDVNVEDWRSSSYCAAAGYMATGSITLADGSLFCLLLGHVMIMKANKSSISQMVAIMGLVLVYTLISCTLSLVLPVSFPSRYERSNICVPFFTTGEGSEFIFDAIIWAMTGSGTILSAMAYCTSRCKEREESDRKEARQNEDSNVNDHDCNFDEILLHLLAIGHLLRGLLIAILGKMTPIFIWI